MTLHLYRPGRKMPSRQVGTATPNELRYKPITAGNARAYAKRSHPISVMDDFDELSVNELLISVRDKRVGVLDLNIAGAFLCELSLKALEEELSNSNAEFFCKENVAIMTGHYKSFLAKKTPTEQGAFVFVCSAGMVATGSLRKFSTNSNRRLAFRTLATIINHIRTGASQDLVNEMNNFEGNPTNLDLDRFDENDPIDENI